MSLVIGSFGAACLFLGRTFSLRVFIYPKEGLIVAGKRRRVIGGNERVQITRLPGLHYFVITFSDGETIKFLPQYPIYKQMTSSGAEAFWEKLVKVKES
ncbi:hypothetical protein WJU23_00120 [Prosthecobacter sp. SYSU 5D2]|uniref:hypothetical protein n=1 Tax=Prosthecobacter sp. SYSU 5D2 TaxID=3134134 RepID=UPI0031FF3A8B